MDQGSNKNHSPAYNFTPTVTKFCVMWEGLSLPHDTKFGNCRCKIVDSRSFHSWSLIHGLRWSGLIKVGPGLVLLWRKSIMRLSRADYIIFFWQTEWCLLVAAEVSCVQTSYLWIDISMYWLDVSNGVLISSLHYSGVAWALRRLESPTYRLCFQQLVEANKKEHIQVLQHWSFVGTIYWWTIDIHQKGPVMRKVS